jgi:decaprenylphospho-beta-D-erythro-pentofuranosid-2-ulose 2-reductase
MERILIIGATSAIATETARLFAKGGAALALVARDQDKLERLTEDLRVRGAHDVYPITFDAAALDTHAAVLREAISKLGEIDKVLIAHGSLPDQAACEDSWDITANALAINLLSPLRFLTDLATYFEGRGSGNITVISSVAGDRGRKSNYVYGTSKAALSTFLGGLRNRLAKKGVTVTTIKPGFVDTPMTGHIPKTKLFASASAVGARVHKAMVRGEDVVYTPIIWLAIMTVITAIPERIFKKLSI